MDLSGYLSRIGLRGRPRADLDTLRRLHRQHLAAIPYENLDVQLGNPVTRDAAAIFDKLVARRRGGWCYEMNGLLWWALEEIGFRVRPLAAGVGRSMRGDSVVGNHLVLLVELDDLWLADVGFGDGFVQPLMLRAARFQRGGFRFRLRELDDEWWRLHNHTVGAASDFDFRLEPADRVVFDAHCHRLQTSVESIFVQTAVVQRFVAGEIIVLRGKVLSRISPRRVDRTLLGSADEYVSVLRETFDLAVPEAKSLWPRIEARHREFFGADDAMVPPSE